MNISLKNTEQTNEGGHKKRYREKASMRQSDRKRERERQRERERES